MKISNQMWNGANRTKMPLEEMHFWIFFSGLFNFPKPKHNARSTNARICLDNKLGKKWTACFCLVQCPYWWRKWRMSDWKRDRKLQSNNNREYWNWNEFRLPNGRHWFKTRKPMCSQNWIRMRIREQINLKYQVGLPDRNRPVIRMKSNFFLMKPIGKYFLFEEWQNECNETVQLSLFNIIRIRMKVIWVNIVSLS